MGNKSVKEVKYQKLATEEKKEKEYELVERKEEKKLEIKEPLKYEEKKLEIKEPLSNFQKLVQFVSRERTEREIRMEKILNFVKNLQDKDPKFIEAVKQNLLLLEFEYWFPSLERILSGSQYVDRNALGRTIRGYKLARIMEDRYGVSILRTDMAAVITLHVPTDGGNIKCSSDGSLVLSIENEDINKKFCTGRAYCDSFQFLGDIKAIDSMRNSEMKYTVVSNVDKNFRYTLQHVVYENNFGKQGVGCTQGIHFFVSIERMLKYAGCKGFLGEEVKTPCLSPPVYNADSGEGGEKEDIHISVFNLHDNLQKGDVEKLEKNIESLFGPQFFMFNPRSEVKK